MNETVVCLYTSYAAQLVMYCRPGEERAAPPSTSWKRASWGGKGNREHDDERTRSPFRRGYVPVQSPTAGITTRLEEWGGGG